MVTNTTLPSEAGAASCKRMLGGVRPKLISTHQLHGSRPTLVALVSRIWVVQEGHHLIILIGGAKPATCQNPVETLVIEQQFAQPPPARVHDFVECFRAFIDRQASE